MEVLIHSRNVMLSNLQESVLRQHLQRIDPPRDQAPRPRASVTVEGVGGADKVAVTLRLDLGTRRSLVVSHRIAPTPEEAMQLATEEIEERIAPDALRREPVAAGR